MFMLPMDTVWVIAVMMIVTTETQRALKVLLIRMLFGSARSQRLSALTGALLTRVVASR